MIGLDPDHAAAYLVRCQAKSELGWHEEAIEDYDDAVLGSTARHMFAYRLPCKKRNPNRGTVR